ncbi:U-box domain-containing protein [Scheffersomyces xylosifermentans]|uniref:U-box domain-containing protein n=1 Tax=Scheffersomyces xylosifermentans TaxID=1304137 RepID=UPI00315CBDC4
MESLWSNIVSQFTVPDTSKVINTTPQKVQGTPEEVVKYVYNDILLLKNEIRNYNELTGILNKNSFYHKLIKLMQEDHFRQLEDLKKKCEYQLKSSSYQRQLVELYKQQLHEYCNLRDILKNNYNHGLFESRIVNYRSRSMTQDSAPRGDTQSLFSIPSRSSSVSTTSSRKNSQDSPIMSSKAPQMTSTMMTPEPSRNYVTGFSQPSVLNDLDKISNEAPDHLLDPISFQLFSDPVITPSGITYEKSHLLQHLRSKGNFDPLTRAPLQEVQLYPNLVMKDSVQDYIRSKTQQLVYTTS